MSKDELPKIELDDLLKDLSDDQHGTMLHDSIRDFPNAKSRDEAIELMSKVHTCSRILEQRGRQDLLAYAYDKFGLNIRGFLDWLVKNPEKATDEDRLFVYKQIRAAGWLPEEAAFHLVAWHILRIAFDRIMATRRPRGRPPKNKPDWWTQIEVQTFRDCGEPEMADLYLNNRAQFDTVMEAGRKYFHP